jgi:hypothetical protein
MPLSRFDFMITYCPSNLQGKPDALSQQSYLAPDEGDPILDIKKVYCFETSQYSIESFSYVFL